LRMNDVMPHRAAGPPVNPHKVGKVHRGDQSIGRSKTAAQCYSNARWTGTFSLEKTAASHEKN
jgi:hypothetical protein